MNLLLLTVAFGNVAFIGESPMASADDVTQTKTVINSNAVGGDLTQCIVQSNAVTKNAHTSADSTSFTFRDVTQTSTLSNSGAVGRELVQYIIHINGLTHGSRTINFVERLAVNGDATALTLTGPARVGQDSTSVGSTSNVFRDVTQTSTLSNSGAITGDLIQYIIHINGMNTNQLQNIADSAGSEVIHQLLKKLVDKMSVHGI